MPFAELLRCQAAARPHHVAIKWGGGALDYATLHRRTNQLAQALSAAGIGAQDRVAVLGHNTATHLELVFAAAKLRAVAVPVNFRLSPQEIAEVVDDSQAKVMLVGDPHRDLADAGHGWAKRLLVVALGADYERWLAAQPDEDPGGYYAPHETAYQLYSSGTTGRPKGIEISAAGMASFINMFVRDYRVDADTVNVVSLPLFHIGGNGVTFATHLAGGTNYIVPSFDPAELVDLLESERCTHAGLVPAQIQMMLAVPGVADRDFSAMRCIPYGGAPIPPQLLSDALGTFGCDFFQGYGLTEVTGGATTLSAQDHLDAAHRPHLLRSVGRPNPGTDIRIVDPGSGEVLPSGDVGEIWIKSPQTMKGYWNQPELTAETIVDGWLRSGDAGYFDTDGYLYLHDRIKDMIVSGGENIYSADIEIALAAHPAVAECAVIAVPSERWGETPTAIVVPKAHAEVTAEELIAHCRGRIAAYKCPTSIEWADELPRNPTGKVLKWQLREQYSTHRTLSERKEQPC